MFFWIIIQNFAIIFGLELKSLILDALPNYN